ncbi:MAG: glucosaminidase domain-containing protein [Magnetococcus sp. YQC-3]
MAKKNNSNLLLMAALAAVFVLSDNKKEPAPGQKKVIVPAKLNSIEFFVRLKPYALALNKKIGVPYLFIMAQIALETAFGKSSLFYKYWNVGGIKAKPGQKYVELMTWEYVKDRNKYPKRDKSKDKFINEKQVWKIRVPQKFAIYDNLPDGLAQYAKILQNRYFKKYANKTSDPKKYARLIQSGKPKYATDINYIPKIDKLIDLAAKA